MLINVFGALAFLGTVLGLVIALLAVVYLLATRKVGLAFAVAKWTLAGLAVYFGLLVLASVTSAQTVLSLNQEQRFCAADCDLAFSVTGVRRTQTLGNPPNLQKAQGTYYVATVKMSSDAARVTMQFNDPVYIKVVDADDRNYTYSPEGQRALDRSQGRTGDLELPWAHSLHPGESASRDIVFDIPSDVKSPALVIQEGGWESTLVIGDENSLFHKQTKIRLEP